MLHAIYPTLKAPKHDNSNDNHAAEMELGAYSQQNDLNNSIIKTIKLETAAMIDPKHENSPPKAQFVTGAKPEMNNDKTSDTSCGSGDDAATFDEVDAIPVPNVKTDPEAEEAASLAAQRFGPETKEPQSVTENIASSSDNESSCSSESGSGGMEMLALGLAMYCDVGDVKALEEVGTEQDKPDNEMNVSEAKITTSAENCVDSKSTADVPQDQNNNSASGLSKASFSGSSLDADFLPEPESKLSVNSVEFVPGQERHIIKGCSNDKERSMGYQKSLLDMTPEDFNQYKESHEAKGRCKDHGDQVTSDDKTNAKGDLGNSSLLEERCNLQSDMSPNHTGDGDKLISMGHANGPAIPKGDSNNENDVEVEEIQAFLDHILGRQLEVVRAEKMESPGNASPTIKPVSITLKESDIDTSNSSSDLMESSKDTESDEQADVSFDMPKQISKECLVATMEAAAKAPKDEQAAKIQAALEASGIARGMNSQELMEDPSQSPRGKTKYAGKKSPYVTDKSKKSGSSKSKKKVRFKASTKRDSRDRPPRPSMKYPARPRWSPEEEYYADFPSPEERRYPPWVEAPSWRSSRDKWERAPHYQRKKFGRSPPGYSRSPPVHVVSPPPQRISRVRWAQHPAQPMVRRYSPPSHRSPQYKKRHSKNIYAYEDEAIYDDPWFDYYEYIPPPLPPGFRVARGPHRGPGSGRSRSPNFSHPSKTNENWRKGMHENKNSSASTGNTPSTSPTTLQSGAAGKELVPHKPKSEGGKDESPRTSLYVGDLHFDVTEAMLFELFSEVGPLTSIRVCRDKFTRKSLGYGYVNYLNPEDAERAHRTLNFSTMKGREIRLMWAERDPSSRQSGVGNLFVKNLDRNITNKVLHSMFSPFGEISSCKVAFDERGLSRGYGFVHFVEEEASFNAILKMNGKMVNGRKLNVSRFRGRNQMQESDGYDYEYDDYETVPVSGYPIFLPGTHPSARIPMHDEP